MRLTWGRGPAAESPLSLADLTENSPERVKPDNLRRVVILVHIATRNPSSARLDPADVDSLLAMLRAIAYRRGIRVVSLCAFNLDQEKILFDQPMTGDLDLEGLQSGIRSLRPGTIDYSMLMTQSSGAKSFLGDLLSRRDRRDSEQPDAVIILGPQAGRPAKSRKADLRAPGTDIPLFYLRYAPGSGLYLWNDAIRDAVHARKGGLYDIRQAADFWKAWTAIESTLGPGSNK